MRCSAPEANPETPPAMMPPAKLPTLKRLPGLLVRYENVPEAIEPMALAK